MNRGAGELPVRQMQIVTAHGFVQLRNVIGTNLMAQTSRTRVNQNNDSIFREVILSRCFFIKNFIDVLHLDKVIARAQCAELRLAALFCAGTDGVSIRAGQAAAFLGVIEVGFRSHVVLDGPSRPFL